MFITRKCRLAKWVFVVGRWLAMVVAVVVLLVFGFCCRVFHCKQSMMWITCDSFDIFGSVECYTLTSRTPHIDIDLHKYTSIRHTHKHRALSNEIFSTHAHILRCFCLWQFSSFSRHFELKAESHELFLLYLLGLFWSFSIGINGKNSNNKNTVRACSFPFVFSMLAQRGHCVNFLWHKAAKKFAKNKIIMPKLRY